MVETARWINDHTPLLIEAATRQFSQDETLKTQAAEIVATFFDRLQESIATRDNGPLNTVLEDWVAGRSAPTEGELTRLVPVLATFKQVIVQQVRALCEPEDAVDLLITLDGVFTDAIAYLSRLEADALLADMRNQVQEAENQLKRLDKSKSDFIAVAAHELRTPITLVEGYSNMLRTSIPTLSEDPIAGPLLDGVEGGVQRLREIIRDMIDVSLISLNMLELHLQPAWLNQIIDALQRNIQPALIDRNLDFVIDYDTIPQRPTYGDPERLLQVLQKIVTNAIKYTPDGGTITITGRELTGFVDIMVVDSGIGIDPDNLPHIFSMFSTLGDSALHSSSKTKFRGGGPGLGLFISKGIIEAHGGNIWAESEGYDEQSYPGSTFHILIPMRAAPVGDTIEEIFNNG